MILRIDQKASEPLYVQIRNQIIAGIAKGELRPGQPLPSVRALAGDLGINLHTVNKAYAVLRDEGYVLMRGRAGAVVADPCEDDRADKTQEALAKMEDELFELALAHRARGGSWGEFLECAQAQAARAYHAGTRSDADASASSPLPSPTPLAAVDAAREAAALVASAAAASVAPVAVAPTAAAPAAAASTAGAPATSGEGGRG